MSNTGSFPKVGVAFVAENADEYAQKLNAIATLYGKLQRAIPDVQSAIKNSGLSLEQQQHALDLVAQSADASAKQLDKLANVQVMSNKAISETNKVLREQAQAQSLAASAVKTPTTQAEQTDLLAQKAEQDAYARGQKLLDLRIRQALAERDYAKALQLNAQAQLESAGNEQRLIQLRTQEANINRTANASPITSYGRELGAVLSVAFAVNSAIDLVSRSLSGKLTPAAREAADSVRIVFDTALLGLSTGGVPGAVVGALAGAVTALGISALKTDPQVLALNDALDKLGKKDDATEGLAKLAKVTDATAQAALDYAKSNQDLATSLQTLTQAAQQPVPILQGLGDIYHALDTVGKNLHDSVAPLVALTSAFNTFGTKTQATVTFLTVYTQALADGKTATEALAIATAAGDAVLDGHAKATDDLTKKVQQYADIQIEINQITTRASIQSTQDRIDKMRLEGASVDELRGEYIKLYQLIGSAPSSNGARNFPFTGNNQGGATATNPVAGGDALRAQQENDYSFLNALATKTYKDLLKVQQQYNTDSLALDAEHGDRQLEIESNAYMQQLRIEREFGQRKKEIQDRYDQDTTDAFNDRNQRLKDAEDDAQTRRDQVAKDHADRRAKIEQDYQDRVAQIESDYQLSLFDIVARDDAKGLIRARLQREKALADAQKSRDRENADNDKQKAKQEKDLNDALEKQKKKIEEEYQKRLRELGQQFKRENDANNQNYNDQITDLVDNTTKLRNAEDAQYKKRKKQLDDQLKERQQSILDNLDETLSKTKDKEAEYGAAIITAMKDVLDPQQISGLLQQWQKALEARIEIKVTPFNANLDLPQQPPGPPVPHAAGGYIARNERAILHAGETVLPTDPQRAYQLAEEHLRRLSLPANRVSLAMGASGYAAPQSGKVYIYVDNSLNNAMLSSQIRTEAIGVTAEVIRRSTKAY